MHMSESRSQRSEGSGATWVVSLLTALVLYALSPMPIIKVIIRTYGVNPPASVEKTFGVAYAPIGWLIEKNKPIRDFYGWYGEVWQIR
jgi:hypothetical protein